MHPHPSFNSFFTANKP